MTLIPKYLKDHLMKEFEYQKQVRANLQEDIGINTPITEKNKDAVLKAREIAAEKTGYKAAKISIFGVDAKTCEEDIYGNPIYSPYEYPIFMLS